MQQTTRIISGSIIGLKKEFEEQYIALHKHTFPGVLDRISRSNISDYSIYLHNGILFSHMIYSGTDYEADMQSIGTDQTTLEWWLLTDIMQQPVTSRNENEWWSELNLWFGYDFDTHLKQPTKRYAFTVPMPENLSEKAPDQHFGDIGFWATTYELKALRIFTGNGQVFIYIESTPTGDISFLLEIVARILNSGSAPIPMQEVFHTETSNTVKVSAAKKVFVTGCFDMLHSGHVAFLSEAATFGDLYVSIGADENVRHLKGRYPVNSQDERKYMIDSLGCVKKCMVNTGWGLLDFENELAVVKPDVFVVNEDGHTPAKQNLCKESGIDYHILKRIPHEGLPVRSTTTLRTVCNIPFRIDLAGGWLDQPYVSKFYPGSVLTISIEPTVEFNDRSGMSSSTRRKAIELWHNEIPHGNTEHLARMLFSFENPPGTKDISGSQDSLGIVLPGLNKLDYNGGYWPEKITTIDDEEILGWIENKLYLVTLGPRVSSYSPLQDTEINEAGAKALAQAADACWNAILKMDVKAFGNAFTQSFESQIAMFPHMVDSEILANIDQLSKQACGWKLSGAGGGGYIILVSDLPVKGAMQVKIRRKNSF